ncbi:hypothetical protein BGZ82_009546 [Podila clonocystis]|nr:hypothetical protein BGZ82_009546 [Podila clonocystis]
MRFSNIAIALAAAALVHAAPTSIKRSEAAAAGVAENSPGWGSGNVANIPIAAPVNACGDSVTNLKNINMRFSVIAIALAAAAMVQAAPVDKRNEAAAQGEAHNSPGWGSGNVVNVPVTLPVNACGNSVSWIGLLNPAKGNACQNA